MTAISLHEKVISFANALKVPVAMHVIPQTTFILARNVTYVTRKSTVSGIDTILVLFGCVLLLFNKRTKCVEMKNRTS